MLLNLVLEKTLESPLDNSKEIKPTHPKGNQSWIFIGRTDAEADPTEWLIWTECESWTVKKAECWRINAFKLWCWRRLLRVPWTAGRSNKSIPKIISPQYSWKDQCWSWSSNTLATCCEGLTHWNRPWCWARSKAGVEVDNRGWDGWMASPTWWRRVWTSSGSWWWKAKPGVIQSMWPQRVGDYWVTELYGCDTDARKEVNKGLW